MSIAVPLYGFGASGGSPNKSTIIVTAPTGSTVTCKMGSTTKTAAEKNGVWTFGGLDLGTWTITSTKGGDSATQDVVITRLTVEYVTIVYRITPEFTYTGDYEIVDDSDNPISDFANWKNNWKIRFLTSGTLTFTNLNGAENGIDVFLVGGGGGGGSTKADYGGGGGGGYTKTARGITVQENTPYEIVVGSGGAAYANGGNSSAFGSTANGGKCGGTDHNGGNGGSGGGGYSGDYGIGGAGGSDGSDGADVSISTGGNGQGTTTREFGESTGKLYSGGGGGGGQGNDSHTQDQRAKGGDIGGGYGALAAYKATSGATNTGSGGGGRNQTAGNAAGAGGSGIVIIRNARGAA